MTTALASGDLPLTLLSIEPAIVAVAVVLWRRGGAVDMVVGPGNAYVEEAKRRLFVEGDRPRLS